MTEKQKIWVLCSEANVYDAYGPAFICWWKNKPSLSRLADCIGYTFPGKTDEEILFIVKLWSEGKGISSDRDVYFLTQETESEAE